MLQDRRIYKTPHAKTFVALPPPFGWLLESYRPGHRLASLLDRQAVPLEHLVVTRAGRLSRVYYASPEPRSDEAALSELFRDHGWDWKQVGPVPSMRETAW